MREAGVTAKNARKEPCDSVFEEFEFLSYLYAQQAEAIRVDGGDDAVLRDSQVRAFLKDHALVWLPSFMRRTAEQGAGPYAALAGFATAVLAVLENEPQEA